MCFCIGRENWSAAGSCQQQANSRWVEVPIWNQSPRNQSPLLVDVIVRVVCCIDYVDRSLSSRISTDSTFKMSRYLLFEMKEHQNGSPLVTVVNALYVARPVLPWSFAVCNLSLSSKVNLAQPQSCFLNSTCTPQQSQDLDSDATGVLLNNMTHPHGLLWHGTPTPERMKAINTSGALNASGAHQQHAKELTRREVPCHCHYNWCWCTGSASSGACHCS